MKGTTGHNEYKAKDRMAALEHWRGSKFLAQNLPAKMPFQIWRALLWSEIAIRRPCWGRRSGWRSPAALVAPAPCTCVQSARKSPVSGTSSNGCLEIAKPHRIHRIVIFASTLESASNSGTFFISGCRAYASRPCNSSPTMAFHRMEEILHQLMVYPILYRVSTIQGGAGFLPQYLGTRHLHDNLQAGHCVTPTDRGGGAAWRHKNGRWMKSEVWRNIR